MEKYLPQFEYLLFDIPRMGDEQIGGDALLKSLLVVRKYIQQRDPREKAAKIATAFRELKGKRSDIEEIPHTVLLYLYQTIKAEDQVQVKQEFERTLREGEEIMPTLAEYYIQQGKEEGIQIGLQKGKKEGIQEGLQEAREAILDILKVRFNRVPRRLTAKFSTLEDIAQLRELRRKALTAASMKEFE